MSEDRYDAKNANIISMTVFASRWLQAPLYFGLIIAQMVYVYKFAAELFYLVTGLNGLTENEIMLVVLGLIDLVMVSNLLIMITIGGYETFVSRLRLQGHPDMPEWLRHINANTMKIKLSTALVGISSIHLLKTFFNLDHMTEHTVFWQVTIHTIFLFSSLALAYTSKLSTGENKEY